MSIERQIIQLFSIHEDFRLTGLFIYISGVHVGGRRLLVSTAAEVLNVPAAINIEPCTLVQMDTIIPTRPIQMDTAIPSTSIEMDTVIPSTSVEMDTAIPSTSTQMDTAISLKTGNKYTQ